MASPNTDIPEKTRLMEKRIESLTVRVKEAEEQWNRTEQGKSRNQLEREELERRLKEQEKNKVVAKELREVRTGITYTIQQPPSTTVGPRNFHH